MKKFTALIIALLLGCISLSSCMELAFAEPVYVEPVTPVVTISTSPVKFTYYMEFFNGYYYRRDCPPYYSTRVYYFGGPRSFYEKSWRPAPPIRNIRTIHRPNVRRDVRPNLGRDFRHVTPPKDMRPDIKLRPDTKMKPNTRTNQVMPAKPDTRLRPDTKIGQTNQTNPTPQGRTQMNINSTSRMSVGNVGTRGGAAPAPGRSGGGRR